MKNSPSGLMMVLKAMGIEFDPEMFKTMRDAVVEVRDTMQRIEEKLDRVLETTCLICGEKTAHKCKLENCGGHGGIQPTSAVTSTKEKQPHGTNGR